MILPYSFIFLWSSCTHSCLFYQEVSCRLSSYQVLTNTMTEIITQLHKRYSITEYSGVLILKNRRLIMALYIYTCITDNWRLSVIGGVHLLNKRSMKSEHHLFAVPAVPALAAYQAHSSPCASAKYPNSPKLPVISHEDQRDAVSPCRHKVSCVTPACWYII